MSRNITWILIKGSFIFSIHYIGGKQVGYFRNLVSTSILRIKVNCVFYVIQDTKCLHFLVVIIKNIYKNQVMFMHVTYAMYYQGHD